VLPQWETLFKACHNVVKVWLKLENVIQMHVELMFFAKNEKKLKIAVAFESRTIAPLQ
jgi:hypothetical protein